jgi:hypothetical protein
MVPLTIGPVGRKNVMFGDLYDSVAFFMSVTIYPKDENHEKRSRKLDNISQETHDERTCRTKLRAPGPKELF